MSGTKPPCGDLKPHAPHSWNLYSPAGNEHTQCEGVAAPVMADPIAVKQIAKQTVSKGFTDLIDYLLRIGADPTDNDVWRQAKRIYLRTLIEQAQEQAR